MIIALIAINKISNIINFLTRKLLTCQLHPQTDSQLHPLSQQNILDELLSLSLATKVHLKYFVEIMDEVANLSEDVADRLIISSSKN